MLESEIFMIKPLLIVLEIMFMFCFILNFISVMTTSLTLSILSA